MTIDKADKKTVEIIMAGDDVGSELVKFADRIAANLVSKSLTRAQIRNIFTEVRKIEASWDNKNPQSAMRRLNMLKPKLDYQVARARPVELLRDILVEAIEQVDAVKGEDRNKRFRIFMDLFEAILAYHRAKGGRTN